MNYDLTELTDFAYGCPPDIIGPDPEEREAEMRSFIDVLSVDVEPKVPGAAPSIGHVLVRMKDKDEALQAAMWLAGIGQLHRQWLLGPQADVTISKKLLRLMLGWVSVDLLPPWARSLLTALDAVEPQTAEA